MSKRGLLMIGLASLMMTGYCSAKSIESPAMMFKHRCANCHGEKANGVPRLKEQPGVSPEAAAAGGSASQEKGNIYGPPLNVYSKEELFQKLKDLRNKDYDTQSYHSVMRKNLKQIEAREGKVDDEKMAEYISGTFGPGKN